MLSLKVDDTFVKHEKEILFYIVNFNKYHLEKDNDELFFTNYDNTKLSWKFNEVIYGYLENRIYDIREYFINYPKITKELETFHIISNIKNVFKSLFNKYENYHDYCDTQHNKLCNVAYINQNIINFIESINYNYNELVEGNNLFFRRISFINEIYESRNVKIHFTIDTVDIKGVFNDEFSSLQYEVFEEYLSLIKQNKITKADYYNIENSFYRYSLSYNDVFNDDLKKYHEEYLTKTIGYYYD